MLARLTAVVVISFWASTTFAQSRVPQYSNIPPKPECGGNYNVMWTGSAWRCVPKDYNPNNVSGSAGRTSSGGASR